jgi:hypothetical protein
MRKLALLPLLLLPAVLCQVKFTGPNKITGPWQATQALFTALSLPNYSFSPSGLSSAPGYIAGLPRVVITPTGFGSTQTYDSVGYQFGYCCPTPQGASNAEAILWPYAIIPNGATNFEQALHGSVAHGVVLAYNSAQGSGGFSTASNWEIQDLNQLSWYQQGVASCVSGYQNPVTSVGTPCTPIVGAYVDGWIQGTQMFGSCGARSAPYCVLAMWDWSVGDITDVTGGVSGTGAWQLFTVPSENGSTTLGLQGYTGACSDGSYIYYPGLSNPADGAHGYTLRYTLGTQFANDSSKPGGIPATGGTPNWTVHNMKSTRNPQAYGFFGCRYDQHRFIYFFPTSVSSIVRYDTWGGGSSANPSAFNLNTNYTSVDMTTLGGPGPNYTGIGQPSALIGASGGGAFYQDSSGNQWIYAIPWSTGDTPNPNLSSTTVRAKVGQVIGGTWYCADFTQTSTDTLCPTVASAWEIYNLVDLQNNPEWTIQGWLKKFATGIYAPTTPTISGWQLSWLTAQNKLVYVANAGNFFVEYALNSGKHLYDPTAWSVGMRGTPPANFPNSAFGGAFNSSTGCGIVVTPSTPVVMYCGL